MFTGMSAFRMGASPEMKQTIQSLGVIKNHTGKMMQHRWGKLQKAHVMNVNLSLSKLNTKARNHARENFQAADRTDVPFWEQGSRRMNTEELWAKRMALRKHRLVREHTTAISHLCDPTTAPPLPEDLYPQLASASGLTLYSYAPTFAGDQGALSVV